jgi:hypothetical protein
MTKLNGSRHGIIVNKTDAQLNYTVRFSVFPSSSRLNVYPNQPEKDSNCVFLSNEKEGVKAEAMIK